MGRRVGFFHLPDFFLTNGTHEVLDVRLCEVLVIVIQQFAVDGGHCHKYINLWSLRIQELFPDLRQMGGSIQQSEDSTAAGHMLPPASTPGLSS